jgi:hypothetical protein
VTIAIAYPLTACVLIEQIFIMPEVKVNRKNGALKSFPAAAPGTGNSPEFPPRERRLKKVLSPHRGRGLG